MQTSEHPETRRHAGLLGNWRAWLPSRGTVLFTLVVVAALYYAGSVGAFPLSTSSATSTSTISYQGRLADSTGDPLTGEYNLEFRIYDVPTGGTPLWTEMWTGGNAVDVSDGLFNVMLGSIDNTLASSIEGEDELYLGVTVGTDAEMVPRVQLGSVPFSMQAMTVLDGSITTEKLNINSGLGMTGNLAVTGNANVNGSIDSSINVLLRYATVTTDAAGQASAGVAYVAVLKPAHWWNALGNYWSTDYDFTYNSNIGLLSDLPPNRKVVVYYVHQPNGQGNPLSSPPDW